MQVDHGENIIEIKDVSFSYGEREVLRGITLDIHRGDYLGIVGGNGSGKTTLIRIILGLLKPSTGNVRLFGTDIREFKDWHKIGYVPQQVTNFDRQFPASVQEIVLMGRFARRGLFKRVTMEDGQKAEEALRQVGMWEHRNRLIGELSGGQQQRVFIARALAGQPEILFLDEPTVGIERVVQKDFYTLLRKLNSELDLTVVLITHDVESMAHEAMHVACLDCTLFFHDSVDAYFKDTHRVFHPHP